MKKRIGLGVFESARAMNSNKVAWTHPESRHAEYTSLDFWVEMARMLDDAGFDYLFFADGYSYPITDDGRAGEMAMKNGSLPGVESSMLLATLAYATRTLGIVATTPTGLDHPIQTARRFASIDHLSGGRIGWNMVTGSGQDTIARLFGHDAMRGHEARYEIAYEYVDLCLRYWEGCWEDDAVVRDRGTGTYADVARVHRIDVDGRFYRTSGYLAVEPSPQRTPVLFQAGTSETGKDFAARYAECVFVKSDTMERTAASIADIRRRAEALGRNGDDIKMYSSISVMAGRTSEDAHAFRRSFLELQSDEAVASTYRNLAGIDLLALDPSLPLTQRPEGASLGEFNQSDVAKYMPHDGKPAPTVREILDDLKGYTPSDWVVVGDGVEVADKLERIADATGLDGFMLQPALDIAELKRFIDYALPELERRGRRDPKPEGSTFRERMFGSSRLKPTHPGAAYRVAPVAH